MIIKYCNKCAYHEVVEIEKVNQSRCGKENCLSLYTKCVTEEALRQFLKNDKRNIREVTHSALEICYEFV